jgi:hypothetical protein
MSDSSYARDLLQWSWPSSRELCLRSHLEQPIGVGRKMKLSTNPTSYETPLDPG